MTSVANNNNVTVSVTSTSVRNKRFVAVWHVLDYQIHDLLPLSGQYLKSDAFGDNEHYKFVAKLFPGGIHPAYKDYISLMVVVQGKKI